MAAQAAQRLHSGSGAAEVAEALEEEIKSWRRHPGFATAVLKRLGSGANVEVLGHVLSLMQQKRVELNVIHCNTAIKACCSGAWLQALNFLEQMLQMRLKPDVFTYSSVMTACLKEMNWHAALQIFHNCKLFLRPDLALSNCGLHALNLAGQWEAAKHLLWQLPQLELRADVISFGPAIADVGWKQSALMLETMEASAIEPDRKIFSSFAVTGESEDIWQRSMGLLDLMRQRDLEADVINHSSALAPLAEQLHWQMALAFAAQSDGHHGALSLCNAVLRAVRGEWRMAVAEINGLVMKGLEPDEVSRNTLLAAVGSAERWQTAMQLSLLNARTPWRSVVSLWEHHRWQGLEVQAAASLAMRGSPWEQQLSSLEVLSRSSSDDQAMLSSCLNSCEAASDWQVALALLGSMSVEDFDEVSFGAAISACAKGAQWLAALELLQEASQSRFASDIARNAASSACERGSQWQFCVFFLDGTSPDLISYNVALSATQKASYWKLPCFLLEEMGEETDEISRDTVIFACAFQWRHALEISAVFKRKFFLPESPVLLGSGALSGAQLNRLAEEVEAALLGELRSMMFRRLVDCEENQWVKMGAHHTLEIELNNKLTLGKDRWDAMHLQELDEATDVHKTSEVAVLLMEAGLANFHLLTAVLAKDVHRVSVALPKKRATTTNYDKALVRFFEQVYQGIKDHVNLDLVKCVLLAGPGFVKDDFLAWMIQRATQSGCGCLKEGVQLKDDARGTRKKSENTLASSLIMP
ncbi:unnamed protein product [Durusdinium trenchii]|uniref:Pentatricopeptide repeat-containing protein, chloroplastic n=1 Tax=Durusdinium trenchii TaxID=1381693 RepID=A0ABP0NND9_9DINO